MHSSSGHCLALLLYYFPALPLEACCDFAGMLLRPLRPHQGTYPTLESGLLDCWSLCSQVGGLAGDGKDYLVSSGQAQEQ